MAKQHNIGAVSINQYSGCSAHNEHGISLQPDDVHERRGDDEHYPVKKLFSILGLGAAVSCSAMPPLHQTVATNGVVMLTCIQGQGGEAVEFFAADIGGTNWMKFATVPAKGGQPVAAPAFNQPAGSTYVFTCDATNASGAVSDFSNVVTNTLPAAPQVPAGLVVK